MSETDAHSGIPTQAVHEAYLDMQRALKRYRQANDAGNQHQISAAHGDVQEAVLTFYELLRPHIKHNEAVSGYWEGELPTYPRRNGDAPDPEDGKGVLQVQNRYDTVDIPTEKIDDFAELETLEQWAEALGLNGNVRLTAVSAEDGSAFVRYDAYQMGLRALDDWKTTYTVAQTELGGLLGGTKQTERTRERVGIPKLKRAARELADAAKELGFLPQDEIPDNDDALPI